MSPEFLVAVAGFVMITVVVGLARILWGPGDADRVMAAQLLGTGGIASLLLVSVRATCRQRWTWRLRWRCWPHSPRLHSSRASRRHRTKTPAGAAGDERAARPVQHRSANARGAVLPRGRGRASALPGHAVATARADEGRQRRARADRDRPAAAGRQRVRGAEAAAGVAAGASRRLHPRAVDGAAVMAWMSTSRAWVCSGVKGPNCATVFFISLTDAQGLFPKSNDGGKDRKAFQPVHELQGFFGHQAFGLDRFFFATLHIVLHHFLQVIDIIKIDVVQVVDGRVQVSGHRNVDEKQGTLLTPAHGRLDLALREEVGVGAGGADKDVRQQLLFQLLQGDGFAAEALGQLDASLQGAVGDDEPGHPLPFEMFQGQFGHFARAHQEGGFPRQVSENLLAQANRSKAHADRVVADARFGAHLLGNGKGLVEEAVEHRAGGPGLGGLTVSLLHLSQNLGLAHHQGIQAGGHPKDMLHRVGVQVDIKGGFHFSCGNFGSFGEKRLDALHRGLGVLRHAQYFHPVAGQVLGRLPEVAAATRAVVVAQVADVLVGAVARDLVHQRAQAGVGQERGGLGECRGGNGQGEDEAEGF